MWWLPICRIGRDPMHRRGARTAARWLPASMPGAMSAMMNAPLPALAHERVSRSLSQRDRTWCHRPLGRLRPGSHDVPTQFKRSSSPVPTRLQRGGNFVGTLWEPVFRYRAPLRGDVFSNFELCFLIARTARGLCHRGCFRDRPAVTIRSLSPLISTRPKFFKALAIPVGMTWAAVGTPCEVCPKGPKF
jgi:hypothetical protein